MIFQVKGHILTSIFGCARANQFASSKLSQAIADVFRLIADMIEKNALVGIEDYYQFLGRYNNGVFNDQEKSISFIYFIFKTLKLERICTVVFLFGKSIIISGKKEIDFLFVSSKFRPVTRWAKHTRTGRKYETCCNVREVSLRGLLQRPNSALCFNSK